MTDQTAVSPEQADREKRNTAAWHMRRSIERAVAEYAAEVGEPVTELPAFPGALSTVRETGPAAGIHAAGLASDLADGIRYSYVRKAREAGTTWQGIGEALGLDQGDDAKHGYELGTSAYEAIVGENDIWHQPTLGWTCPACSSLITDHGPYESHPEDNERGHADECTRLAAEVRAHQLRMSARDGE